MSEIIFMELWWPTLSKIEGHFIYFQILALELRGYFCELSPINNSYQMDHFVHAPSNWRRRYNVASSLIGWAHTQNDPWYHTFIEIFWNLSNVGIAPSKVTASLWKVMIKFEWLVHALMMWVVIFISVHIWSMINSIYVHKETKRFYDMN